MENKNDGLHFSVFGAIDNASSFSKSLRKHGSIRIMKGKDRSGKDTEFAFVYFQRRDDGGFTSPTTALKIDDMRINIQAVNTYQGARLFAISETGKKSKIRVDTNYRWQERGTIGTSKGTVARVSRGGNIQVSLLSISREAGDVLRVERLDVYQTSLPVNNPDYLKAAIDQKDILRQFEPELSEAIRDLTSGVDAGLDLSQAIKRNEKKTEEPKTPPEEKKEEETVEIPPESKLKEKEITSKKKVPPKKKATDKKFKADKKATAQKNLKKEKAQKKVDQADVDNEFVGTAGEQTGSSAAISTKLNLKKFVKK